MTGRYTFVSGKDIKTRKENIVKQLEAMCEYAQDIEDEEDSDRCPPDSKRFDKEKRKEQLRE